MTAPSLRPYQQQIIEETRAHFRAGVKTVVVNAATGAGKTLLTAHMLKTCADKKMAAFFVVHRRELVAQVVKALGQVGVKHDVIANGYLETRYNLIKVCSIGALRNRAKNMKPPTMVVWDECHHCAAKSWDTLHALWKDAYHIGLSATPERLDGQGLSKYFKQIVKGPSIRWLIDNGFLSDYRIFAPESISTEGIRKLAGDFAKDEVAKAADKPTITGNVFNEYLRHAMGKRAVIFATSIAHSEHLAAVFNANGVPACHVDGATDPYARDEAIRLFAEGKIFVLTNVELFGEGFDLPAIECVIDVAPTLSITKYRQRVGRGLRPSPGKTHAILIDHAGNVQRHGLPEEEIEWNLDGHSTEKRKQESRVAVKICPFCFAAQTPGPVCRFCGKAFEVKAREIAKKEGELKELDLDALRKEKAREVGRAKTYEELVAIGLKRGYKDPQGWAAHVHEWRKSKGLSTV